MSGLRTHFLLSHLLPWLVIIPVMGLALVYILETQVLLGHQANELASQASLVAELAGRQPEIWADARQAQAFVDRISVRLTAPVMLIDAAGRLLATSNAARRAQVGQPVDLPMPTVTPTATVNRLAVFAQAATWENPDITVPVIDSNQHLLGVVRLARELSQLDARLLQLRYLITGVLAVGLLFGAGAGWWLAVRLERPIQQSALAITQLSSGRRSELLPESGPAELRTLAQAINTLVRRLRLLEQSQKRLLANLVHELGRPLGALQAAMQALLDGADGDPALRLELLLGMNSAVATLRRLLDDMTEFHEQLLAPLVLQCRPVVLAHWLPEVLAPWQQAALAKGLRWQADIPTDLPTLTLDAERLDQAVGNLLSNAIKYTPASGQVTVAAGVQVNEEQMAHFWLRIGDTGPGIAPEEQATIFAPFYRSRAQRRFPQGMGLGLSIAQELATAHGGQITVQSTPGVGSCFTLTIPLPALNCP